MIASFAAWWRRRSLKAKIGLISLAVLVGLVILGALVPSTDDDGEKSASPPPPAAQQPPPRPPPPPPPPPVEKAPAPVVLRGQGARIEAVRLRKDSPVIVQAVHRGFSNFALELVGRGGGSELLVNEIGNYSGEVAYADATAGRYRLKVTADGPWTVSFAQPVPSSRAKRVPGKISGTGSDVVKVQAEDDLQPIVTVRHRGQSNFVVQLIGYGDTSGTELLVNEIGNYSGQTLVNDMPEGSYLIAVQADGPWTVRFSP